MTFILNTSFTDQALSILSATGTNVIVSKSAPGNGSANVAWVVFRPLEQNILAWEEEYGIYASTVSIQNGATLSQMATTPFPAAQGMIYTLLGAGFFGAPTTGGASGSYTASNQFDNTTGAGFMTFGLYQNAVVNGSAVTGNAVSAAPVIFNSQVTMTPFTTIFLWTQSQVVGNSVVTNVTSPISQFTFGGPVTELSLSFDLQSGVFVPGGGTVSSEKNTGRLSLTGGKLPAGVSLSYRMPVLS